MMLGPALLTLALLAPPTNADRDSADRPDTDSAAALPAPPADTPIVTSQPVSAEQRLWEQIEALGKPPKPVSPYTDYLAAQKRRRERRLAALEQYLTSYPGGRWSDDAVRLRLVTLYELASLTGGDFRPLSDAVELYLRNPRTPAVEYEAAYWEIYCRHLARTAAEPQPSSMPVTRVDPDLLVSYADYIQRYPASPYTPRLAEILFQEARERRDVDEMRRMVELLNATVPDHAIAIVLAGQLHRDQTVGKPFEMRLKLVDGATLDFTSLRGRPVLIVFWSALDTESRSVIREIEEWRCAHDDAAVIGVNLDESRAVMSDAITALSIDWPQHQDPLGPATEPARNWGVRASPTVFGVDRAGRFVGWARAGGWRWLTTRIDAN